MGSTKKHEKKSKKKHKHKTKESKHKSKKLSKKDKQRSPKASCSTANVSDTDGGFEIPVELMNSKSHAPITPEEYQRKQKEIRRVTDPSTGRTRLIRGDGEVLEEIVSKKRHAEINKAATMGDGEFFQEQTVRSSSKKTK